MSSLAAPAQARELWRFFTRAGGLIVIGAVLSGGALVGGSILTDTGPFAPGGPPVGEDEANIWVDNDGSGSCFDSPTPIAYVASNSCSSLDAANDTCEGGDVVGIMGGTYSQPQEITGSNGRSGTRCTMTVPDGQTATFTGDSGNENSAIYINGASYLTLDGGHEWGLVGGDFTCCTYYSGQLNLSIDSPATQVTVRYFDGGTYLGYGTNVVIEYSDLGPHWQGVSLWGDNSTIRYSEIHGIRETNPNQHNECIRAWGGQNVTFNGVWVHDCETFAMLVKGATTMTVENSVFGPESDGRIYVTNVDAPGGPVNCEIVVRNSTFVGDGAISQASSNEGYTCEHTNHTVPPVYTGNLFDDACCQGSYSAFASGTPSGTNVVGSLDFTDANRATNGNYDIGGSSIALGAGNPSNHTAADKDGVTRGNPPDAGAYEGP